MSIGDLLKGQVLADDGLVLDFRQYQRLSEHLVPAQSRLAFLMRGLP
jgi:hypothetical protein